MMKKGRNYKFGIYTRPERYRVILYRFGKPVCTVVGIQFSKTMLECIVEEMGHTLRGCKVYWHRF